jgi:hypothetical protein
VRPFFRKFVPLALQEGLHIAIVTFSKRVKDIEDTLVGVFGEDNARNIVVRGRDERWIYVGSGCKNGKQTHMASAGKPSYNFNFAYTFYDDADNE